MECEIVLRTYEDCFFTDFSQPTTVGIGSVLLDEDFVGCLTWTRTNLRVSRGIATTKAYGGSFPSGTNDSIILSFDGTVNTNRSLASITGIATDLTCAQSAGYAYAVPEVVSDFNALLAAVDADTDAIVLDDPPPGIPVGTVLQASPNVQVATNLAADETPLQCTNGMRVVTYPPANFEVTENFLADFNCGLYLIAQNGTYDAICTTYDGGDRSLPPFCLNSADIEKPRKSCR